MGIENYTPEEQVKIEKERSLLSEEEAHDLANNIISDFDSNFEEYKKGLGYDSSDYEKAEKEILELKKWADLYNNKSALKSTGVVALNALMETLGNTPVLVAAFGLSSLIPPMNSGVLSLGTAGYIVGKYIENFFKGGEKIDDSRKKIELLSNKTKERLSINKEDEERKQWYKERIESVKSFKELFNVIHQYSFKTDETAKEHSGNVFSLKSQIENFVKKPTQRNLRHIESFVKNNKAGLGGQEIADKIINKAKELLGKDVINDTE